MVLPSSGNPRDFMATGRLEYIKSYSVYDGTGRLTDIYEARSNAADGSPCLRTRYSYDGTTSRIVATLEVDDTWQTAFEEGTWTYPTAK